jgi:hypothetical protein
LEFLHKLKKHKDFVLNAIDIVSLKNNPVFDSVRSEHDFQEFISEMEGRFESVRLEIDTILHDEAILVPK